MNEFTPKVDIQQTHRVRDQANVILSSRFKAKRFGFSFFFPLFASGICLMRYIFIGETKRRKKMVDLVLEHGKKIIIIRLWENLSCVWLICCTCFTHYSIPFHSIRLPRAHFSENYLTTQKRITNGILHSNSCGTHDIHRCIKWWKTHWKIANPFVCLIFVVVAVVVVVVVVVAIFEFPRIGFSRVCVCVIEIE